MAQVFISYKSEQRSSAKRIKDLIQSALGCDVFWDQGLQTGGRWSAELDKELLCAKCVVVLWSAESSQSPWVNMEAAVAKAFDKLVPARIDACEIPEPYRSIQTADLIGKVAGDDHAGLAKLMEGIRSKLSASPSEDSTPPTSLEVSRLQEHIERLQFALEQARNETDRVRAMQQQELSIHQQRLQLADERHRHTEVTLNTEIRTERARAAALKEENARIRNEKRQLADRLAKMQSLPDLEFSEMAKNLIVAMDATVPDIISSLRAQRTDLASDHMNLARGYLLEGRWHEAYRNIQAARPAETSFRWEYMAGIAAFNAGRSRREAASHFAAAFAAKPAHGHSPRLLALVGACLKTSQPAIAKRVLQLAIQLMGEVGAQEQHVAEARYHYVCALALAKDNKVWRALSTLDDVWRQAVAAAPERHFSSIADDERFTRWLETGSVSPPRPAKVARGRPQDPQGHQTRPASGNPSSQDGPPLPPPRSNPQPPSMEPPRSSGQTIIAFEDDDDDDDF